MSEERMEAGLVPYQPGCLLLDTGPIGAIRDDDPLHWMGLPSLLLALIVLKMTGAGFWNVVLVLAVTRWMVYVRVTRSLALSYRENVLIEAVHATCCRICSRRSWD